MPGGIAAPVSTWPARIAARIVRTVAAAVRARLAERGHVVSRMAMQRYAVRWRELQAPAALPAADWRSTVVRLPAEALASVHDLLRHPPPRPPGAAWPAVTWPA